MQATAAKPINTQEARFFSCNWATETGGQMCRSCGAVPDGWRHGVIAGKPLCPVCYDAVARGRLQVR